MNCELLKFSPVLSQKRLQQAQSLFGATIVCKVLAWALFLLGVQKKQICSFLDMKEGSLRTFLFRLKQKGLSTLEDGRAKASSFKPVLSAPATASIHRQGSFWQVQFSDGLILQIPENNPVQLKVFLLTLFRNKVLSCSQVASVLQLSEDRIAKLGRKLEREDVPVIVDQRHGQQKDYRFTPEIKGMLIQQFVLDLIQNGSTNASRLTQQLHDRIQHGLSSRSILDHMGKLGLTNIQKALAQELEALKKTTLDPQESNPAGPD